MQRSRIILASALIGIVNTFFFIAVEFVDTKGTNYLWNDLFNTSENRLGVIPLAIILSIIFSAVILFFKEKRIGKAETNLLSNDEKIEPNHLKDVFVIFIIGCTGLLAGASLGPEGVLVGISSALGIWFAGKAKNMEAAKLLVLASVGALLVNFFGSFIPILVPLLIIYKKEKKINIQHMLPPIIAGVFSYIALVLIKGNAIGFGTIPTGTTYNFQDLVGAFILGIFGAFVAFLIKKMISKFEIFTKNINSKTHWIVSAAVFGCVLGILYLIGGPTIQFSGKEGSEMLLQGGNSYSLMVLVVIIIAKLFATSWSLPAGYRGGLVFPSIFMAVAMSLILTEIHPILGGPGITIGATAGMMTSMLPPLLGFILVLSMIPLNFILVAICGLFGAIVGTKIIALKLTKKSI